MPWPVIACFLAEIIFGYCVLEIDKFYSLIKIIEFGQKSAFGNFFEDWNFDVEIEVFNILFLCIEAHIIKDEFIGSFGFPESLNDGFTFLICKTFKSLLKINFKITIDIMFFFMSLIGISIVITFLFFL